MTGASISKMLGVELPRTARVRAVDRFLVEIVPIVVGMPKTADDLRRREKASALLWAIGVGAPVAEPDEEMLSWLQRQQLDVGGETPRESLPIAAPVVAVTDGADSIADAAAPDEFADAPVRGVVRVAINERS